MDIGRAMLIAAQVHVKQKDLSGRPYILHPIRVSQNIIIQNDGQRVLALLHDTLEDYDREEYPTLFQDLEKDLFQQEFWSLQLLSHGDKISWDTYITRISEDPLATRIKVADLEDNMNILRLLLLTEKAITRLKKYHEAWMFLKKRLNGM